MDLTNLIVNVVIYGCFGLDQSDCECSHLRVFRSWPDGNKWGKTNENMPKEKKEGEEKKEEDEE